MCALGRVSRVPSDMSMAPLRPLLAVVGRHRFIAPLPRSLLPLNRKGTGRSVSDWRNKAIAPYKCVRCTTEPATGRALDPVAQISLFGKLKLLNCANFTRVETAPGFCLFGPAQSGGRPTVGAPLVGARGEGNVRAGPPYG